MNKKQELLEKIDELHKNPKMTIDDAIKQLNLYESPGEFVQIMAEVLYRVVNNDFDTAKEISKHFLGHTIFVLDKVGQGDVEIFKNELLKAMKEQAVDEYKEIQKANEVIVDEKFVTVKKNNRKKSR